MKKILITVLLLFSVSSVVSAQGTLVTATETSQAEGVASSTADPLDQDIVLLQKEWARIKYQIPDETAQLDALHKLEAQAAEVLSKYPDRAEPKIWQGIIVATDAGLGKWFSALGKVKRAKVLFEDAIEIDPEALDGAAYTSLGSLYYQVPGWPMGFGDKDKAKEYLLKGLSVDPNGIDSNYFYADFLMKKKQYKEARTYLQKALQAPDRPLRSIADAGRRGEIKAALAQIEKNE